MMGRTFNATTSRLQKTSLTDQSSNNNWTLGAWIYLNSAGENSSGQIFHFTNSGFDTREFRIGGASLTLYTAQYYSGGGPGSKSDALTSTTITTGKWWCVIAQWLEDAINLYPGIFIGDVSTPMAEASYTSRTTPTGTPSFNADQLDVGTNWVGNRTFDGIIARPFWLDRKLQAYERELYRLGRRPASNGEPSISVGEYRGRGYWPLDSLDAGAHEDLSGRGNHLTATDISYGADAPIPRKGYF